MATDIISYDINMKVFICCQTNCLVDSWDLCQSHKRQTKQWIYSRNSV